MLSRPTHLTEVTCAWIPSRSFNIGRASSISSLAVPAQLHAAQIPLSLDHGDLGRNTAVPRPLNPRWPPFIPGNTGGDAGLYFPERPEFLQAVVGYTVPVKKTD